jgi:superfamily II DNA or RNA helicase
MSAYACNARRVIVITPSKHISHQMFEAFCNQKESFLVKRKIVTDEQTFIDDCRPSCHEGVQKTTEIVSYFNYDLVITNAHKFGTTSRVNIEAIPEESVDLVIVDEAHHCPAKTWATIIAYFNKSKKIFFTATPKYNDHEILQTQTLCFRLNRSDLVNEGIIRDIEFCESSAIDTNMINQPNDSNYQLACQVSLLKTKIINLKINFIISFFNKKAMIEKIKEKLKAHDALDQGVFHQAMILCQTIDDRNPVEKFVEFYNENVQDPEDIERCDAFTGGTPIKIVKDFKNLKFRALVICGCLLEGFDHPNVSVVGIARNVQSPIIFSQFVGRAFRKIDRDDPVKACIVSDEYFKQKKMWDSFETVPESEIPENLDDVSFVTVDDEPEYLQHVLKNN